MSRYAPVIDQTGITGDDFPTTLAKLTADALSIFGADTVLSNDTQDGQLLGVFALGISDCVAGAIAAFNSFSPAKAQGNGLHSLVKINGLTVKIPSASIITVTVVGVAQTPIENGQVSGVFTWALPALVTIPDSGTIDVQAVCTTLGANTEANNAITTIKTNVFGWQTVTNGTNVATAGTPVETDPALRVRQSQSVALPSQTIFEGIVASIGQISGVTRKRGYENATGLVDANGIPSKTLSFIVEGGLNQDIWNAIAAKITPGVPTLGAQSATVVRPSGSTRLVNFDRPTDASFAVILTLKALQGWSATLQPTIAAAVSTLLNGWPIGGDGDGKLSWSELLVAARIIGQTGFTTFKIESISLNKNAGGAVVNTDVVLAFNEAAVPGAITFTMA